MSITRATERDFIRLSAPILGLDINRDVLNNLYLERFTAFFGVHDSHCTITYNLLVNFLEIEILYKSNVLASTVFFSIKFQLINCKAVILFNNKILLKNKRIKTICNIL